MTIYRATKSREMATRISYDVARGDIFVLFTRGEENRWARTDLFTRLIV